MYQPKEVARILQVSRSTIRRWASDFYEYLSPTAQPAPPGDAYYRRAYSRDDLLVLWTIREESKRGATQDEIAALLAAGEVADTLPPDLPAPEDEPVEMVPLSTARVQIEALQARVTNLEMILEEARVLADARADRIAALERELGDARAELARAEGRAEIIESERRPASFWLRVLLAVALAALILGALLAVLTMLASGGVGG
jgi:DNA-binding transcriptional MerR regulator